MHKLALLSITQLISFYFPLQAHPWFRGVQWDKLYQMKAAFIPEVNGELDTQNFEKFEEVIFYCSTFPVGLILQIICINKFYLPYKTGWLSMPHNIHCLVWCEIGMVSVTLFSFQHWRKAANRQRSSDIYFPGEYSPSDISSCQELCSCTSNQVVCVGSLCILS